MNSNKNKQTPIRIITNNASLSALIFCDLSVSSSEAWFTTDIVSNKLDTKKKQIARPVKIDTKKVVGINIMTLQKDLRIIFT